MDFGDIVATYSERIYWTVRRIVVSHEDANDVVQNVFIKAWGAYGDFRGQCSVYTWLYRIAVNESLSFLRSSRRHTFVTPELAERELSSMLDSGAPFDGEQVEKQLQIAIQTLPERQKAVFLMRYYDETPYAEISQILGASEGALKASYHHAAKKIEEQLNVSLL